MRKLLGIDLGSVSVDIAVIDENGEIIETIYERHHGQPMSVAAELLRKTLARHCNPICVRSADKRAADLESVANVDPQHLPELAATGNAGRLVVDALGGTFVNEVIAQAAATRKLNPEVKTIIEIGGEDSKLIFMEAEGAREAQIADFAMNTLCAAGTGSFLDQQAARLGVTIEEFGSMALESEHPPRVAGRCSVFAKSDMIHLQQKGTPPEDIVAGLCYALARNFKSTVGSAKELPRPISFQGGVAANAGMTKAMREVLGVPEEEFVIPEDFGCMGAIGAALHARSAQDEAKPVKWDALDKLAVISSLGGKKRLPKMSLAKSRILRTDEVHRPDASSEQKIPAYLGVDVGSISTNVVVMDIEKRVLSKRYLMTAGRPIEAVMQGLKQVGEEIGDSVEIKGACTTGSGRYLIADFIGADVVKNEITAQARGAVELDPEVDTIFEIGGQDSKYISLDNGAIVDFEMNKVCAAGTGSFLEEQAEKLGVSIKGEFGKLALESDSPANLGERCTVFMESELLKEQQAGTPTRDLVAGLCYSVVYNYLNRVVQTKRVGKKIFFQGGTAFNDGVVAAFEGVTGQPITVPPHNEVTGAIGCALIAFEEGNDGPSKFKGFDLSDRQYEVKSLECKDCANRCEINRVTVEGEKPLFYGSRCEKFDVDRRSRLGEHLPDLFAEREELLMQSYHPGKAPEAKGPRVGIPRALLFYEMYPFWHTLFEELGVEIVLSDPTSKKIIHSGAEKSVAETCFPMKVALGHVLNLLEKDIDFIFLPSIINLPKKDDSYTDSFVCPYVQSFTYTVESAVDFSKSGVEVLRPKIYMQLDTKHVVDRLKGVAGRLGKSGRQLKRAVAAAQAAQELFGRTLTERGKEILSGLKSEDRALVIVSRSYNGCDPGANLEIPRKLRNMGVLPVPMDMLPLDEIDLPDDWNNMYWRYGQKILSAAEMIAHDKRLHSVYLTNFGCGPDSFITKFFSERMGAKPVLFIEIDEHSADAGIITRCEAFLDSLPAAEKRIEPGRRFVPKSIDRGSRRIVMVPNMSPHAYALAAAFQSAGMPAEVLPEPDEETLMWGRKFTTGKECFPCIVTTGDMIKFAKRPGFDRDKYAFFMGGSGGPCRFGQYNALQRMALDSIGFGDVPIFAPNQARSFYDDMGLVGSKFLRSGWKGIVAADVLEKALRETRPYEAKAGEADRVFRESLDDVCEAIAGDGDLLAAMKRARRRFDSIETYQDRDRPVIGLVGEFYVRANAFSNQDVVGQIEALGGEVWSAPIFEWFLYRNVRRGMRAALAGEYGLWLKNKLKDHYQKKDEAEIVSTFEGFLRNLEEPRSEEVLDYAAPYVHRSFEGEAILTVGKAIDFVLKGLSGVVAVMPFTCMPGTISHAILKRVREEKGGFPFLNMVYDGLEQPTAATRLEAFMHQAREYKKRLTQTSRMPAAHRV
jgi:predicted CoA-substrate-specific enzyme activase